MQMRLAPALAAALLESVLRARLMDAGICVGVVIVPDQFAEVCASSYLIGGTVRRKQRGLLATLSAFAELVAEVEKA